MLMCKHLNNERISVDELMPDERGFICFDCGKVYVENSDGERFEL